MKAPCEKVVTTFLPLIRAYIASRLVTKYNYTQTNAAHAMGISQPAISLYLQGKRGGKSNEETMKEFITPELDEMIDNMIEEVRKGRDLDSLKDVICEFCPMMPRKQKACEE